MATGGYSYLFLWLVCVLLFSNANGSPDPEDCVRIDAGLLYGKYVYLFHDDEYVKLDDTLTEVRTGSIRYFGGLKGPIDAALKWSGNRRTYFFKSEEYFSYSMLIVGPYDTNKWDTSFADGIDAAGNRKGMSYFFKDCSIVRMESKKQERSETLHSDDLGLPCAIDAAFSKNDILYIIKGKRVWEWGNEVQGPFPISDVITLTSWNVCPTS